MPQNNDSRTGRQLHLHSTYYITKQLIPALDRLLSLAGVDIAHWYRLMPKHTKTSMLQEDAFISRIRKNRRKVPSARGKSSTGNTGVRMWYRGEGAQQRLAQTNIDHFYRSRQCVLCEDNTVVNGSSDLSRYVCADCMDDQQGLVLGVEWKLRSAERRLSAVHRICASCCQVSLNGPDYRAGELCISVDCPITFQKRNLQTDHEMLDILACMAKGQELW